MPTDPPPLTIKLRLDRTQAKQDQQRFRGDAKAIEAEILSDARAAEAAKRQLIAETNRAKIAASREAMRVDQDAAKGLGAAMKGAGRDIAEAMTGAATATVNFSGTLGRLGIAAAGVRVAMDFANGYRAAIMAANVEARTQLDNLLRTKDAIREIVSMTGGKGGVSDMDVQKFTDLRVASGLTNEQAKQFSLQFEGAGQAAKGQNISDVEYERVKPMIARFAASFGGDANAAGDYGKLGGLLAGLGKYEKAEDLLATEVQFNKILSLGVGDNPQLIQQQANVAGAFLNESGTGSVKSPRELAAMVATASRVNPAQSAELLKSVHRVVRGSTEKWAPLLEAAGVEEKDTDVEAMNKLFAKMEEAEKSGRSVDAFLREQGLDTSGAMSLQSMYNYRGFMNRTLAENATPMTGQQAIAEIDRRYREDSSLQIRQEEARTDQAKLMQAAPKQNLRLLEQQARTRIEREGKGESSAAARQEDLTTGKAASGFGVTLPRGMTEEQLGRMIREERAKRDILKERGIDVAGRPGETSLMGGYSFDYVNWVINGGADLAYEGAANEMQLRGQVGGPKVATPAMQDAARRQRELEAAPGAIPGIEPPGLRGLSPPPMPAAAPGGAPPMAPVKVDNGAVVSVLTEIRDRLPAPRIGPVMQSRPTVDTRGVG